MTAKASNQNGVWRGFSRFSFNDDLQLMISTLLGPPHDFEEEERNKENEKKRIKEEKEKEKREREQRRRRSKTEREGSKKEKGKGGCGVERKHGGGRQQCVQAGITCHIVSYERCYMKDRRA